jgi:hypothetical protein
MSIQRIKIRSCNLINYLPFTLYIPHHFFISEELLFLRTKGI